MAALALRGCGGGASLLLSSYVLRHGVHPAKKMLMPWKQPVSPFLFTGQRKFHTAPVRAVLRFRPIHILVATGGGYAGYRQYERQKEKQLEQAGGELIPRIASNWQLQDWRSQATSGRSRWAQRLLGL